MDLLAGTALQTDIHASAKWRKQNRTGFGETRTPDSLGAESRSSWGGKVSGSEAGGEERAHRDVDNMSDGNCTSVSSDAAPIAEHPAFGERLLYYRGLRDSRGNHGWTFPLFSIDCAIVEPTVRRTSARTAFQGGRKGAKATNFVPSPPVDGRVRGRAVGPAWACGAPSRDASRRATSTNSHDAPAVRAGPFCG